MNRRNCLATFLLILPVVACAGDDAPGDGERPLAPLFDNLGDYHHEISTTDPRAQRFFDQGLVLGYGFNHAEAIRSYEAAAEIDPQCAMCFWGIAFALGPNINAGMDDSVVPRAWEAAQEAVRLASGATAAEQALIAAIAERYSPEPPEDRSDLDLAFADAMREAAAEFPNDPEIQTLFAESLMDTTPWSYWTEDLEPKPETQELLAALESVIEAYPDHPGALHLYVHAVEASSSPERAEAAADRLGDLVPGAGHLVHMPSHIYLRLGRYDDASLANQRAAAADESYIANCNAQGFYPALYYPHNIHFLWFSSALEGRSAISIEAGEKVAANVSLEQVREFPELENFLPIPLFSLVRFGRWEEILAQPAPSDEFDYLTAMWHYARGLAQVAEGSAEAAEEHLEALVSFAASEEAKALDMPDRFWPGAALTEIASEILAAELAGLAGPVDERVEGLRKAVELQDAMPYMEPPYWYYPVRHSLGAALLDAGKAADAEEAYREDLEHTPRNGWSLFGLEQSLTAQRRSEEAAEVRERFAEVWSAADVELSSSRY